MGHLARIVRMFAQKRYIDVDSTSRRLLALLIKDAESKLEEEDRARWLDLMDNVIPSLQKLCYSVLPVSNTTL